MFWIQIHIFFLKKPQSLLKYILLKLLLYKTKRVLLAVAAKGHINCSWRIESLFPIRVIGF